jgi:hypothetical protein
MHGPVSWQWDKERYPISSIKQDEPLDHSNAFCDFSQTSKLIEQKDISQSLDI